MRLSVLAMTAAAVLVFQNAAEAKQRFSGQQCASWFAKIDRNRDGAIGGKEGAARYFDMVTRAGSSSDREDDFIMSRQFFLIECKLGSFDKPDI